MCSSTKIKCTIHSYSTGPTVRFLDEVETVRAEVEKLKKEGIKIIIGLSHAGYGKDQIVAGKVDGIDVIVGGHSHTFLYTGNIFTPFYTTRLKFYYKS